MTDVELMIYKLGEIRRHVARARRRRGDDFVAFAADEDRQDALLLSVMVALQDAFDCAFHIAVESDLGVPTSNADAFARLAAAGILTAELATTMSEGARLRNRIAHGYATVELERFWRELPEGLDALEAFGTSVASLLSTSPS